ncbi:MAG: DUF6600 domain-containing protein [Ignavibacteria bacterium]
MKYLLVSILSVIIFLIFTGCSGTISSQTQDETQDDNPGYIPVSLDDFQDSLSQDGQWVTITPDEIDPDESTVDDNTYVDEQGDVDNDIYTQYIWVPSPYYVYEGWNPYCNGRWVWTDWGWMWVSNYTWGWYPYHYGRWWHSRAYGWVWSPGHRWAPAWVSWRHSGGYVGWRPLSPREHFDPRGSIVNSQHVNNNNWVFVDKKKFTDPIDKGTVISIDKNKGFIESSTELTGLNVQGKKIINSGPDLKEIENAKGTTIIQKPVKEFTGTSKVTNVKENPNNNKNVTVNKNDNNNTNPNNNGTNIKKENGNNTNVTSPKTSVNKKTYSTSKSYNSTKTYNTTTSTQKGNTNQTNRSNQTGSTTKTGNSTPKTSPPPKTSAPLKISPPPKTSPPQKQNPPPKNNKK